MPAFRYDAVDAQGRARRGVLEADSARAARAALRAQALVPMQVDAVQADGGGAAGPGAAAAGAGRGRRALTPVALALWTRQLGGLLAAGLPLERALTALCDEAPDEAVRTRVAALRADVNAGSSLADAMARHGADFAPDYVAVVAAGEQGGRLATVLERLAEDMEQRQALRARLLGAALYPAIVSAVALAVVLFLVSYVVPQVAGVLVGSRRSLPLLTSALLAVGQGLRTAGGPVLLLLLLGLWAARRALRVEALRLRFDAALLRLPLLGALLRSYQAARFAATLALMCGAGVPILRALQSAADTLSNRALRADALTAQVQVREGAPLASALSRHPRFPALLAMFARQGEQTGQLAALLQRAADQLAAEVQRKALRLVTVLEPLLVVGMGAVVLLIVLAVLLPIIQLNQLAR